MRHPGLTAPPPGLILIHPVSCRTGWLDVEGRKKDADWAGLRADIERVKRTTSSAERAVLPTTSRVFSRDIEGAGRW